MSQHYQDLDLTQFPDNIDQRYIMLDPHTQADLLAINQYNERIQANDFAGALSVIEANPQLKQMCMNAEKWNRHEDMIIAIQRFWQSNIQQYLVNLVVNRGEYDPIYSYNKYDVFYYIDHGEKQAYMALLNGIPAGSDPRDVSCFVPLTLKGEKGESGTGLTWRGAYDVNTRYYLGDCVSHDSRLWALLVEEAIGVAPKEGERAWDVAYDPGQTIPIAYVVEDANRRFVKVGAGYEDRLVVPNADGDLVPTGMKSSDLWHSGNLRYGSVEPEDAKDGDIFFKIVG